MSDDENINIGVCSADCNCPWCLQAKTEKIKQAREVNGPALEQKIPPGFEPNTDEFSPRKFNKSC